MENCARICWAEKGTAYDTGCSLLGLPATEKIPEPLAAPQDVMVDCSANTVVFFVLETTSLSTKAHITHLAAKKVGSDASFCVYLISGEKICPAATSVTGLSLQKQADDSEVLFKDGK